MELNSNNFNYILQGNINNIPTNKILIAMVGLPGLGKSYFSKNLKRNYIKLNKNLNVKVFNAGERRRKGNNEKQDSEWFKKQQKYKEQIAMDTLNESINWLNEKKNNYCALFDATNTTIERRKNIFKKLNKYDSIDLIFVEILCDNKKIIEDNILHKIHSSPNYNKVKKSDALKDFKKRIDVYKKVYKTISKTESNYNYVKIKLGNCMKYPKKKGEIICNNINPFFWLIDYADNIPNYLKLDEKKSKLSSYK